MHLEKVEITNFKSYKGFYTIGPFDRFSCIIGPNGSGKSNIQDAISFVLNAQSSSLRVKNVKSLISNGESESRVKIFIGGNIFEREISFVKMDNQLADEQVKSKYIFNGVKITQKQYDQELEKINIFSKIKNFVIYQGDIIKSDVDLLKSIEIACGSEVFVKEYNMLLEKMHSQNKDLSLKYEKRKDCLEMLREVKEVKEKEQKFRKLIEEKEKIQKEMYECEIAGKTKEIASLKEKIAALEMKLDVKEEGEYFELSRTVNDIRKEATKLQKEYFEKESELSYLKSKKMNEFKNKEKLEEKRELRMKKEEELKTLEKQLKLLYEDLNKKPSFFENNKRLDTFMQSINSEYLEEMKKTKEQLKFRKEQLENVMNSLEKEFIEKTAALEKRLNESSLMNFDSIIRRDTVYNSFKQLQNKSLKINRRNKEIEKENAEKQETLRKIDNEIAMLNSKIESKLQIYESVLADEARLTQELNEVMRDILMNKAKKNDQSKKALILNAIQSLKSIFSGVYGSVIGMIEPTQKKYETAIGVLLSKYDMAVVVENEKVAFDCLRYLKETKMCRMTFLPLSRIGKARKAHEVNFEKTLIGSQIVLAKSCIRYDQAFDNIIDFVFQGALIVENDSIAKDIVYEKKYHGKVCTLSGTIFTQFGLITGGKAIVNKFEENYVEGLLSKRKEILGDLKKNKDRKDAFIDVSAIKEKIDDLQAKRESIKESISVKEPCIDPEDILKQEKELDHLNNLLKDYEFEKTQVKEEIKQIESAVFYPVLSKIGLSSFSDYKRVIDDDLGRKEILIKIDNIKAKISLLREELSILSEDQNAIDHSTGLSSKPQENELLMITRLENELNSLYTELEKTKESFKINNSYLKALDQKRNEDNSILVSYKLHLSRLEESLKDVFKYAALETGMVSFEHVKETRSILELKSLLDTLNKEIDQNAPSFLSDDNSIQTRYNKYNAEYEIAKEAALATKNKFLEVKKQRMDCFVECFNKVACEVPKIYKELNYKNFGEDFGMPENCAYLAFEGDPFTNNLKYYLMPPSKRFTEFKELSGGERSMALLTFLFALSKFKSPPFYIFDEVDSALDKINVERISNYILNSTEQFLVISLKHQFFKKSASLFGVYKCPYEHRSKVLSYRLGSSDL